MLASRINFFPLADNAASLSASLANLPASRVALDRSGVDALDAGSSFKVSGKAPAGGSTWSVPLMPLNTFTAVYTLLKESFIGRSFISFILWRL